MTSLNGMIEELDTATSLIPVCPRIVLYTGIVRSSKISPTPCQSHRNLDAIWVKPSSPIPRSIPIEPTIPREWLESSPRARERSRERKREEARGRIDARYEKFQKADSEKRVGRGMEKDPGSASEFEASRIARKAKLVGGNLSRVRIHLNPPLSPSLRFPRFLFRVTCRERSRLAVGEKRLKGESARRSAEIGSFYAGPRRLEPSPATVQQGKPVKSGEQYP